MDNRTVEILDLIYNQLGILQIQLGRTIDDFKMGTGYDPNAPSGVFGTEILGWHTPLSKES